jgi:competence protein ComEA
MWLIIAIFLAVSLIAGVVFLSLRLSQAQSVEISIHDVRKIDSQGDIYIVGAVARPGIYETRAGDSLVSLISAAGLSGNADTQHVKVYIPAKGEAVQPQKVDLNRAEVWLLQSLPGIGEGRARLIVAYRDKNGPLRSVDDLLKIQGFGPSILDKIRDRVTVGD